MRSDFLASFCFVSEQTIETEFPQICEFAALAAEQFKYFEIIFVLPESEYPNVQKFAEKLAGIKNIRLLVVPSNVNVYRRRVVAASEAIGEAVVVSVPSELKMADHAAMAISAFASEQIIMARGGKSQPGLVSILYYPIMRWVSNYRINRRDMKSIAVPRIVLTAILARPTASLDLRFEPKSFRYKYERMMFANGGGRTVAAPFRERMEFAVETISASVSDFLRGYALFSVVVMTASVAYAVYAVGALIFLRDIQPGWFSTAFTQSLFVFFVAAALGLISLGVAEVYDLIRGRESSVVINEISNTSFFEDTFAVNVELDDQHSKTEV